MTYRLLLISISLSGILGARGTLLAQQSTAAPSSTPPVNAQSVLPPGPSGQAGGGQLLAGQAAVASMQPLGFPLSNVEQQFVLQTLQMWENTSSKVSTFSAEFEKLSYDGVFGGGPNQPMMMSTGTLSFSKPDKGSFKEDKISRWVKKDPKSTAAEAPGDWVEQPEEVGEHWVCDGKAIYEYNRRDKQLVVTTIPEEMRGQAISNGPLPFLFGAKATDLSERYWIRSKQSDPAVIWLEAYPKRPSDAQNYNQVDVMLDRKSMQPTAIQVHLPGGQQRHVYMFKNAKVNEKNLGSWFTGLFSSPRAPMGWKKVRAEDIAPAPQAARPQGAAVKR